MSTIAVLIVCGLDFSCTVKIQIIVAYLLSVFTEYSVFGFCSDNYHVILSFSPITSVAGLKVNFQNSYFYVIGSLPLLSIRGDMSCTLFQASQLLHFTFAITRTTDIYLLGRLPRIFTTALFTIDL